jgi:hypothetical protein
MAEIACTLEADLIMFGFSPKLPVTSEDREWADHAFDRLSLLLGRHRMLEAEVILPTEEHFPDLYDGSKETLEMMFQRICGYMGVKPEQVDLEVFADERAELRDLLPYWSGHSRGCAGLYVHATDESRMVIALNDSQLKDPLALVATLAHELGHAILLGKRLVHREEADMEQLTDLVTVFLGLGIFTANTAARFQQHDDGRKRGWSMQRLGYLPEQVCGYALAKFAFERGEDRPQWLKYLSTNVKADYKQSHAWLLRNSGRKATQGT